MGDLVSSYGTDIIGVVCGEVKVRGAHELCISALEEDGV